MEEPGLCAEWETLRAASNEWSKQHDQILAKWYPYYEMSALPRLVDEFITRTESRTSNARG